MAAGCGTANAGDGRSCRPDGRVIEGANRVTDESRTAQRGDPGKGTILVCSDDDRLCQELPGQLAPAALRAEVVHDGEAGLALAGSCAYALIVIGLRDAGFPPGFDLLKRLRARVSTPIILLAQGPDEVDRILSLELGADDCLSAPYNPRELLARIHAVLRRNRFALAPLAEESKGALVVGDLLLDPGRRLVQRAGVVLSLTAAEFVLLETLLRKAGKVVRREELADHVLGHTLSPGDRSLDTHMSRLRRKLRKEGRGVDPIRTIRNVGYLYTRPADPGDSQTE